MPVKKILLPIPTKQESIVARRKINRRLPPIMRQARALLSRVRHIMRFSSRCCCASNSAFDTIAVAFLSFPQQGQRVVSLKITLVKQ